MNVSESSVEFSLNEKKYMSLLPVDSSNDNLLRELYKKRNSDFFGAVYSVTRPKGQSLSSIKKMIQNREESEDFYYFINHSNSNLLDDDEFLISGVIQAIWRDKYSGVLEVGINIFPEFRGKGIGGKSVDLLISRLFTHFNAYKFIAHILAFSNSSKRLFESRGFVKCGCLTNHWISGGKRHDVDIYEFIPQL